VQLDNDVWSACAAGADTIEKTSAAKAIVTGSNRAFPHITCGPHGRLTTLHGNEGSSIRFGEASAPRKDFSSIIVRRF
jgi:hypothetical protein